MSEFQISLQDPLGNYVGTQIAEGRSDSPDAFVNALVRADQLSQQVISELNADPKLVTLLEEGLNSEQGRHWSPELLAEFKQQILNQSAGSDS